jgi:hypothetical protein
LSHFVTTQRLDGLELEWLCGPEGQYPYGFEANSQEEERRSISQFIQDTRKALPPGKSLSAAVVDDLNQARAWGADWVQWIKDGLLDTLVLRHLHGDLDRIAERVRKARTQCGNEVHLISQLDCWHPQGLRDAAKLLRAAEIALEAGVDSVGVYRADAVEAFELWPAISQLAAMGTN